jgi:glyoxylase-like metal-dependent hydrolase (beta-lactamase superfamily II)
MMPLVTRSGLVVEPLVVGRMPITRIVATHPHHDLYGSLPEFKSLLGAIRDEQQARVVALIAPSVRML